MIDDYFASLALEGQGCHPDPQPGKSSASNLAILDEWVTAHPLVHYVKPRSGTTALLGYDLDVPSRQLCVELVEQTGVISPRQCLDIEGYLRIGFANNPPKILIEGLGRMGDFRPLMHVTDRAPAWTLAVTAIVIIQLGAAPVDRLFDAVGNRWHRLVRRLGGLIFIAIARPRLADYRPADLRIALVLGLMTER